MIEFDAKVKKWGNSLAVVLPYEKAKSSEVKADQDLHIIALRKADAARKAFGLLPNISRAQQLKNELRKGLYDR